MAEENYGAQNIQVLEEEQVFWAATNIRKQL